MAKVKVRLTIRPDEEIEVPEDEVPVLRHQGLLAEEPGGKPTASPATPLGGKAAKTEMKEGS